MEQMIQRFFRTNQWSIVLGLVAFIFCVLVAAFSIGPALLIALVTAIAASIGYMKDRRMTIQQLVRSFNK